MRNYQTVVIIPAAGTGQRMNAGINKIWLPLHGRNILEHVLKVFQGLDWIDHILLVVNEAEIHEIKNFIHQNSEVYPERVSVVTGGTERQDSISNGLKFFRNWPGWDTEKRIVMIHDAARALVTTEIIQNAFEACLIYQAVGVAVPVKDTIKLTDDKGFVVTTPKRSTLWAVQTPQVFDFDLIDLCYQKVATLNHKFTDDCSVAEYCGYRVKLLMGSYENFKITTPEDLIVAEEVVRRRSDANRARV
jgi:2-C-methyl-D-erythritol 4-phosphate cytidylyltransferase